MTAVIYCRISQEDQSTHSLPHQQQQCEEYCQRNGIPVSAVFVENGRSAFTFDRPEWKRMEQYIRTTRSVKYLVIYHLDRFSRATLLDALVKLNEIEDKLGVKVLTVTDAVGQDNKELGVQLMRTINLLFANNERTRIQERTRDGIYRALASGRFTSKAPYGYVNGKIDSKPGIIPDPERAQVVQEIFRLFNSGVNIEAIRKQVPRFTQTNNSAIRDILDRGLYAGIITVPAYKGKPSYEVNGIHEPIISKATYYAAQMKLNAKRNTHQPAEDVYLRGWLVCPECGRKMTAGRSKGYSRYYWYYKCDTHRKNWAAAKVHAALDRLLDHLALPQGSIDTIRRIVEDEVSKHTTGKGGQIMRLRLDMEKVQRKLADTQRHYLLNPDIDAAVYSKVMTELRAQEAELQEKLNRAGQSTAAIREKMEGILQRLGSLRETFHTLDLVQRRLFLSVQLSGEGSWDGSCWTTAGIHPIYADRVLQLSELGVLRVKESPLLSGDFMQGTPSESTGQLLLEVGLVLCA